ncbi:MAG: hypothetical protein CM1200mP29_05160 [Verrucomicrobiota bacterium]|nr:MAG: hypothetical protein CM1200mP29_05160 [Verrucomicrobiota bacterium]
MNWKFLRCSKMKMTRRKMSLGAKGAKGTASGVYLDGSNPIHQLNSSTTAFMETHEAGLQKTTQTPGYRSSWPTGDHQPYHPGTRPGGPLQGPLGRKIRIRGCHEAWPMATIASSADRPPPRNETKKKLEFLLANLKGQESIRATQLVKRLEEDQQRQDKLQAMTHRKVYAGTFSQPGVTHVLYRGDPLAKRDEVGPDGIKALGGVLGIVASTPEQQRRLKLAQWITTPDNPLTPRVIVNRLWKHHFGSGLAATPNDLGVNGVRPTHPELLDWLATELVASGWSLKQIHRLILTSSAWQQSSQPRKEALDVDSGSRLLWRFPPRRLEAEAIRDNILLAAGTLDSQMGGQGFSGFKVEAENVRHYHPKEAYGTTDWRRMLYMMKVRQEREPTFGVFDCPDFNQTAPNRSRSTTPLQALSLLNSPFVLQQAGLLAKRLRHEMGADIRAQLARACQLALGREPTRDELSDAKKLVTKHSLEAFCRALFNTNEFLFLP